MASIQEFLLAVLDDEQIQGKIREIVQVSSKEEPSDAAPQMQLSENAELPENGNPLQWELDDTKRELADTNTQLSEAKQELSCTQSALKSSQETVQQQKEAAEKMRGELYITSSQLAGVKSELDNTNTQLSRMKQELSRTQSALKSSQETVQQQKEAAEKMRGELYITSSQLAGAESELNNTNTQLSQMKQELSRTQNSLKSLQADKQRQEEEAARLQTELYLCRQQLSPFTELLERYNAFCGLPEGRRADLSKIVPCGDPASFLTAGSQRDAAFGLWDYLKSRLDELTAGEQEILTQTLLYFLTKYNSLWKQPIYEWMDSETGKAFDDQRHSRSSDCSRYQGNIETVLLPGIWNRNRNSAERKCIVRY